MDMLPLHRAAGLLLLLAPPSLTLSACGVTSHAQPVNDAPKTALVATVSTASDPALIVTGVVRGARSHTIATETGGRVLRLHASVGDRVDAGDVLAVLDGEQLGLALSVARADERRAAALAGERRRRSERLASLDGHGSISPAEADAARAEALAADRSVEMARSARAEAERRFARAVVRAPVAGVVVSRPTELSAHLASGAVLFEIEPDGVREIAAPIPGAALRHVSVGQTVGFRFGDEPGRARLMGLSARTSAAGAREARFAIAAGAPPVGAAVELSFAPDHGLDGPRHVTVPAGALAHDGRERPGVLALGPGNRLRHVPVRLVALTSAGAVVSGAIAPGERVVAAGVNFLAPGTVVQPVPMER